MTSDFYAIFIGTVVMFMMVSALFGFAFLYQRKLVKRQSEISEVKTLLQSEELKSAYALLEGQDAERERISHDLHDRMGGQLSTIKIYLDLLEETSLSAKQTELLEKLQASTSFAIDEIRAIAHDLNSSVLKFYGFQKAIEQLCKAINESKNVQIQSHMSILMEPDGKLSRDVYHVVQELITNTLKHANASEIRLEINSDDEEINLIYEENGIGFDVNQLTDGLGLQSMRLRIERYSGTLTVDSKIGVGSTFIIEIPMNHGK